MRLASVVVGRGSEKDCKYVVQVRAVKVEGLCSRDIVRALISSNVEELDSFNGVKGPSSMDLVADLQIVSRSILPSGNILSNLVLLMLLRVDEINFSFLSFSLGGERSHRF